MRIIFRAVSWPAPPLGRPPQLRTSRSCVFGVGDFQLHQSNCDILEFTISSQDSLHTIARKNAQLRLLLKATQWPRLTHFKLGDTLYRLPLLSAGRQEVQGNRTFSPPTLRYLAGFFDGDGHVGSASDLRGAFLEVSQSFDKSAILMRFRETFGGSIKLSAQGVGLRKPVLAWCIHGTAARSAAQCLAVHSIGKGKQLDLAGAWPTEKSCRADFKAQLHKLKQHDSALVRRCSWEYCAGLFDADGHIQQISGTTMLSLHLHQKFDTILKCVQSFLGSSLGLDASLRKSDKQQIFSLSVFGKSNCRQVLGAMLRAGLLGKADQARLAIGLTRETATQVREQLGDMTGNQQFGKRFDEAGLQRARRIKALGMQAAYWKRKGKPDDAKAILLEVDLLKSQHKLLNARHENQQLLRYYEMIRGLQRSAEHVSAHTCKVPMPRAECLIGWGI